MSSNGITFAKQLPAQLIPTAYQGELEDENLDAVLGIFHLPIYPNKASLAKMHIHKKMTLLHLLAIRLIKDQAEQKTFSKHIEEPIEVLNKITLKDRKALVTAQDKSGRSFLHLAVFCKTEKFNFVYEILMLIPKEDRKDCLTTKDSLKGWTPLHQIAFIITHEDNLSEKTIKSILSLLPDEDQQYVKEIKDFFGRDYKQIQELKQKKEESKKMSDKKKGEEERQKAEITEQVLYNSQAIKTK
ncbi:MAG: hypothetical protein K1060chlam1_00684 [Candidatus Anoxychlamydiales bacterium]|nr:hypothetical protein [Candidatus Anoxychlamydiales bacterium]